MSRAIAAARRVLRAHHRSRGAVNVMAIANSYAHVMPEPLSDEISGMLVPLSAGHDHPWAIIYNSTHPTVRQRFTIAHELGHVLLHAFTSPHADLGFRVRFRDPDSSSGSVREEIEANQFAAELLMPKEAVLREAAKVKLDFADPDMDAQKLAHLADKFDVSTTALSFRLANLAANS